MEKPTPKLRLGILNAISAPLGFFVLALLIVETFIGSILVSRSFDNGLTAQFVYLGSGMFVLVILVVTFLVWSKPTHLTFSEASHLEQTVSDLAQKAEINLKVEPLLRDALFYRSQDKYVEAGFAYKSALLFDSKLEEAKIGLSTVKSYENSEDLSEPFELLDQVIEANPTSSKAYYNRACLRCMDTKSQPHEHSLDDLREAIKLRSEYREYAKGDKDFENCRDNPEFKHLIYGKICRLRPPNNGMFRFDVLLLATCRPSMLRLNTFDFRRQVDI